MLALMRNFLSRARKHSVVRKSLTSRFTSGRFIISRIRYSLYGLPSTTSGRGVISALETQVYDHPEDANICYFMHMQNNDPTNFWALSSSVLTKCLELVGFRDMRELLRVVSTEGLAQHMARTILVARKPERPSVRPYALQQIIERQLP
jgi:hypothetical protein